ncbi:EcKinase 5, partial [Frankliniella occidentalis]
MSRMYQIEAYTYEVLLPAMENIAHLTDPLPWPRCEFADVQGPPPHTLVLLDMRPEGFVMADRSVFMDEAHCRLALKQLARFHGAGLALKHLKPDHFEEIKKRLNLNIWDTVELRANMKPYNSAMVQVPHVVQDKFPEGSDIQTRLKKLFGAFKEDSIALMGPLAGPGYTIIHNDLHVNNMMYQYDKVTNAVTDCRLIDFQMSVYGLPALDIVTILLVCTEKPMRDLHWDSLLEGYHQELL